MIYLPFALFRLLFAMDAGIPPRIAAGFTRPNTSAWSRFHRSIRSGVSASTFKRRSTTVYVMVSVFCGRTLFASHKKVGSPESSCLFMHKRSSFPRRLISWRRSVMSSWPFVRDPSAVEIAGRIIGGGTSTLVAIKSRG